MSLIYLSKSIVLKQLHIYRKRFMHDLISAILRKNILRLNLIRKIGKKMSYGVMITSFKLRVYA